MRLYLGGGADRVIATGDPGDVRLRVIAGEGTTLVDDSAGGGMRVYDAGEHVEVRAGPGTKVIAKPYEPPAPDSGFVDVEDVPPRDWGSDLIPLPLFSYAKDVGAFIGGQVVYTRHGFRKHPWSQRHTIQGGYATTANRGRFRYTGAFRPENSALSGELDFGYSGIETLRFYGFGNGTSDNASDSFFRVRNRQFHLAPSVSQWFLDDTVEISAGPWLQHSKTESGTRLIDLTNPYGAGSFGLIGRVRQVPLRLTRDTRRVRAAHPSAPPQPRGRLPDERRSRRRPLPSEPRGLGRDRDLGLHRGVGVRLPELPREGPHHIRRARGRQAGLRPAAVLRGCVPRRRRHHLGRHQAPRLPRGALRRRVLLLRKPRPAHLRRPG